MTLGQKVFWIAFTIGAVIFSYIFMGVLQPVTNEIVAAADNSTGNWTAHEDFAMAKGVMDSFPVWQWLIPGFIGLLAVVQIWRGETIA